MTESTHDLVVIYTGNKKSETNQAYLKYFGSYAKDHNFQVKTVLGGKRFVQEYKEKNPYIDKIFWENHGECEDLPALALADSEGKILATQSCPGSFNNLALHNAVEAELF